MKLANQIKVKVFAKEGDNREEILSKLISLFPFDIEKEKINVNEDTALGFNGKEIKIYEIILDKDRHINQFIEKLKCSLDEEKEEMILRQAESRLDDNLDFFIRIDKKKLMEEDIFWITDAGNCFHIKMSIAAFPATREKAIEVIKHIFQNN